MNNTEEIEKYIEKAGFSIDQRIDLLRLLSQMQNRHIEVLKERNKYMGELVEAKKELIRIKGSIGLN